MKTKKPILIILIALTQCIDSCVYAPFPHSVRNKIGFCYPLVDNKNFNQLKVNGFYSYQIHEPTYTIKHYNIYYKDGLFVSFHLFDSVNIQDFFAKVNSETKTEEYKLFYNYSIWGMYKINGDTLTSFHTNHPSFMSPTWFTTENKSYVVNNAIKPLNIKWLINNDNNKFCDTCVYQNIKNPIEQTFTENNNIPSYSDCWLLKEKWIKCK